MSTRTFKITVDNDAVEPIQADYLEARLHDVVRSAPDGVEIEDSKAKAEAKKADKEDAAESDDKAADDKPAKDADTSKK